MDVYQIDALGVHEKSPGDLAALLQDETAIVWVDAHPMDGETSRVLCDVFGFTEAEIDSSSKLSLVPKFSRSPNHVVLTVHSLDSQGHLLELDEYVGRNFLVTVHAAASGVTQESVLKETTLVRDAIRDEGLRPRSPLDLATAIVMEIASGLEEHLEETAFRVGTLDRQMREGEVKDRQAFLEQLNGVRHELLTVYNRASQTAEVARRIAAENQPVLGHDTAVFERVAARFDSVRRICENERGFANGVLEHYQSVVQTKMNLAMERLALIAFLLIPFTIASGLFGMQISAPDGTNVPAIVATVAVTLVATVLVYAYTKRRGWW